MNDGQELIALSPLDGRYFPQTEPLRIFFSEFAYIKYRVLVEMRYLMFLSTWKIIRPLRKKELQMIQSISGSFSLDDAKRIKEIEAETKHDVKAIEYFLKEKLKNTTCKDILTYVHFGLTSDDANNISYSLMYKGAHTQIVLPQFHSLHTVMNHIAQTYASDVMVARTHGQPAVPTTFGKEISVFASRLKKYEVKLEKFHFEGKCNGAVGNYNALVFAYPKVDWVRFSREFISSFGLTPNLITTQILPADIVAEYGLLLYQINAILLGFCQDMWMYISRGLVRQKAEKGQVGSSTMPQKINPIDFENAEGNLQIANSMFELFARKFPISRMQRDISDSTVKRTVGSAIAYSWLAWRSIEKGIAKISFDREAAQIEINAHWEMLAEAMQIYFKLHGDEKGYEKVRALLMGKQLTKQVYSKITERYPFLNKLTPETYVGLAEKLTRLSFKKS